MVARTGPDRCCAHREDGDPADRRGRGPRARRRHRRDRPRGRAPGRAGGDRSGRHLGGARVRRPRRARSRGPAWVRQQPADADGARDRLDGDVASSRRAVGGVDPRRRPGGRRRRGDPGAAAPARLVAVVRRPREAGVTRRVPGSGGPDLHDPRLRPGRAQPRGRCRAATVGRLGLPRGVVDLRRLLERGVRRPVRGDRDLPARRRSGGRHAGGRVAAPARAPSRRSPS